AMGIDDLDGLHAIVQQLGGDTLVALEAPLHVVGGERIAIVKAQPLAQLELVHESICALLPRFGQTRRHVVAGQRLDQRVGERVQEDERRPEPWGLRGIEKRGGDGRVERDGELTVWLALRAGGAGPDEEEAGEQDRAYGMSSH